MKSVILAVAVMLLSVGALAQADESLATLDDWLHKIPGADAGLLTEANNPSSRRIFPPYSFYSVRFTGQPVPATLKEHNLFAVNADGTVTPISDEGELEDFFRQHIHNATRERDQRAAIKTWLRLAEEFRQNGNLRFSISDDSVDVASAAEGKKATGIAAVTSGGSGEIDATLTFDAVGRLKSVESKDKVSGGG